ncbi:MAG: XRE family transcriptional regulator [Chloroflexi bacterium CFX4]|nr:XRE family transcriptional regulator [Chloroflexi bacterium CFX4]
MSVLELVGMLLGLAAGVVVLQLTLNCPDSYQYRLALTRKLANLDQEALARKASLPLNIIQKHESGKRNPLGDGLGEALVIADTLDVTLSFLVGWVDYPRETTALETELLDSCKRR